MKKSIITAFITFFSFSVFAQQEECEPINNNPVSELMLLTGSLRDISDSQYKKVMDFKVNMDGQGSLAVHYENGKPKLLKLHYKNNGGEKTEVLSFDDIAKGKSISYEHPDMKGNAIVVSAGKPFESSGRFKFDMKLRSKMSPDTYNSHELVLEGNEKDQAMLNKDKPFKQMVISPGVRMFSWDGTFKSVEFK